MTLDIITIGDSVVDLIVSVSGFPRENEETVYSDGMQRQLGGSSNFLIMSSRLGLKTGVIDLLGDDELGDFYKENLASEGVDVNQLREAEGTQTAHCICLVDQQGNHSYISFPGATYQLTEDQVDPEYINDSKALYLSGYSLTRNPIRKATLKTLDLAARNKKKIYFDPSPVISRVPPEVLAYILKHAEGVFLNERELKIIAGLLPGFDVSNHGFVVLKQGENGCAVYTKGKQVKHKGTSVKPVDTTGAGDVFNAAYIFGQLNNLTHTQCAQLANSLAAEKVKNLGAGLNVPSVEDAYKLLKSVKKTA